LTSSSESLSTSTTTSESSSSDPDDCVGGSLPARPIPVQEPISKKAEKSHRRSSTLMSLAKFTSSKSIRPIVSGPIQFPVVESAPVTPVTRRSMVALSVHSSSPEFGLDANGTTGQSFSQGRRMRKPSLQLLLRKRSISSLLSRSSPSSPSPQSSQSYVSVHSTIPPVPPLLEINLPNSPSDLGLGMYRPEGEEDGDVGQPSKLAKAPSHSSIKEDATPLTSRPSEVISPSNVKPSLVISPSAGPDFSRQSSTSSAYPATLYYTPRTTLNMFDNVAPGMSSRAISSYSLLDFSATGESLDEVEEDWAESVILAADAGVRLDEV